MTKQILLEMPEAAIQALEARIVAKVLAQLRQGESKPKSAAPETNPLSADTLRQQVLAIAENDTDRARRILSQLLPAYCPKGSPPNLAHVREEQRPEVLAAFREQWDISH